jgi:hypothetical protein
MRLISFRLGLRKLGYDLVKMHMRVLQDLYGVPASAFHQQRLRRPDKGCHHRAVPAQQPTDHAIGRVIGATPRAKTRSIQPLLIAGIDNHQSASMTVSTSAASRSECERAASALIEGPAMDDTSSFALKTGSKLHSLQIIRLLIAPQALEFVCAGTRALS